jgi:hypothetical protein
MAVPQEPPQPIAPRRYAGAVLLSLALLPALAGAAADPMASVDRSADSSDGAHYRGALAGGLRSGQGRLDWPNGAWYEGGFARGLFDGQGHLHQGSGEDYEGQFEQGLPSGPGRLREADGAQLRGSFRRGLANGPGRYDDGHGTSYTGNFRDGHFEGAGELKTPNGDYRGAFRNGRMQGPGRYVSADGAEIYEGQFADDQFGGQGSYERRGQGRYEGHFVNWRPEGPGSFIDPQGNRYEGQFHDGNPQGSLRVTFRDGTRYEGPLHDWQPSGEGVLTQRNGDVYRGSFAEGRYEGRGVLSFARPAADGRTREEGLWHEGRLDDGGEARARADLEAALYGQPSLLLRSLSALQPRRPGAANLFLLAVAGDGTQEVFRREAQFVQHAFDERFGTRGHSVLLVNSRSTVEQLPLATLTSIGQAIRSIAARMDREQDILFLFLTSHGSRAHDLALGLDAAELPPLGAAALARMLRDAGIRWKVVVVSACYGGGFIGPLRDGHTLILTAARADRRSFGCSDDNDFTYFGRAYFEQALPTAGSFEEAFERARGLIAQWEARDAPPAGASGAPGADGEEAFAPSLPQMEDPPEVAAMLRQWWAQAVPPLPGAH